MMATLLLAVGALIVAVVGCALVNPRPAPRPDTAGPVWSGRAMR